MLARLLLPRVTVLATLLMAVAARPERATAAPLAATFRITADEDSKLTDPDRALIRDKLQQNWDNHRQFNPKGWNCAEGLLHEPDSPSRRPRVKVEVNVTRRTLVQRATGGNYAIEVKLTVVGQGGAVELEQVEVDENTEDADADTEARAHNLTVQEIAKRAGNKLAVLLDKYKPCSPKAQAKVRAEAGGEGVKLAIVIDAEGDLVLREDGSFETTLPVTAAFEVSGLCTGTMPYSNAQLTAKGTYNADDDALRIQLALTAGTQTGSFTCAGVTCSVGGGAFTCPIPVPGGISGFHDRPIELDLSEGGPLTVALEDNAAAPIPVPAGMAAWNWTGSLRLSYGSGAAAVAALASAAAPASTAVTPPGP